MKNLIFILLISIGFGTSANAGVRVLKQYISTDQSIANTVKSNWTTIFDKVIRAEANDFVIVDAHQQFSENDFNLTTVRMALFINGQRISPIAQNEVTRGYAQNHHMTLQVHGQKKLNIAGNYHIQLQALSTTNTTVIVDDDRQGALNIEHYSFSSTAKGQTLADVETDGPDNSSEIYDQAKNRKVELRKLTISDQKNSILVVNAQLSTSKNNQIKNVGEMVQNELSITRNGAPYAISRVGENVTRTLTSHTLNLGLIMPILSNSFSISQKTYNGNGIGFVVKGPMTFLQGLIFNNTGKYFYNSTVTIDLRRDDEVPSNTNYTLSAANITVLSGAAYLRTNFSAQLGLLSGDDLNCDARINIEKKNTRFNTWALFKSTPVTRRTLEKEFNELANLNQRYTVLVPTGVYRPSLHVICNGNRGSFQILSAGTNLNVNKYELTNN